MLTILDYTDSCVCVCVSQLMKLNEDWDHIYRSTTAGLQQRVTALEHENSTLKQLNGRLLIKVEHEQVQTHRVQCQLYPDYEPLEIIRLPSLY